MAFGASNGRRKRKGFSEINLTPLVDVLLVLLVIFMVTAPLLTVGLHVDLPNAAATSAPVKDTKLVLTITKEERVVLGEQDVTANVEQALSEHARIRKENEVYIRADRDVRYAVVARVVAAARAAGVGGLSLLVEPTP